MIRLEQGRVVLTTSAPAEWLQACTGAPWQATTEGLVLTSWDDDEIDQAHLQRRLAVRAQQALACVGRPGMLPLDPSRVKLTPVSLPVGDELPIMQDGFELRIVDDLATMADLAEAISAFANDSPWSRTRPPHPTDTCEGCPHCCEQPVPISSLDIARLAERGVSPNLGADGDLAWCMVPLADGYCKFLDRDSLRCTVHQDRPWVCRSFFCCPEGPVSEAVRDEVLGHILASTADWGVDTPLCHITDYRQALLVDMLSSAVWLSARG